MSPLIFSCVLFGSAAALFVFGYFVLPPVGRAARAIAEVLCLLGVALFAFIMFVPSMIKASSLYKLFTYKFEEALKPCAKCGRPGGLCIFMKNPDGTPMDTCVVCNMDFSDLTKKADEQCKGTGITTDTTALNNKVKWGQKKLEWLNSLLPVISTQRLPDVQIAENKRISAILQSGYAILYFFRTEVRKDGGIYAVSLYDARKPNEDSVRLWDINLKDKGEGRHKYKYYDQVCKAKIHAIVSAAAEHYYNDIDGGFSTNFDGKDWRLPLDKDGKVLDNFPEVPKEELPKRTVTAPATQMCYRCAKQPAIVTPDHARTPYYCQPCADFMAECAKDALKKPLPKELIDTAKFDLTDWVKRRRRLTQSVRRRRKFDLTYGKHDILVTARHPSWPKGIDIARIFTLDDDRNPARPYRWEWLPTVYPDPLLNNNKLHWAMRNIVSRMNDGSLKPGAFGLTYETLLGEANPPALPVDLLDDKTLLVITTREEYDSCRLHIAVWSANKLISLAGIGRINGTGPWTWWAVKSFFGHPIWNEQGRKLYRALDAFMARGDKALVDGSGITIGELLKTPTIQVTKPRKCYIMTSNGLYFGPPHKGTTAVKAEAHLYDEDEAKRIVEHYLRESGIPLMHLPAPYHLVYDVEVTEVDRAIHDQTVFDIAKLGYPALNTLVEIELEDDDEKPVWLL
jgi:hypothetical protein